MCIRDSTDAVPTVIVDTADRGDLDTALAAAVDYTFDLAAEIPLRAWLWQTGSDEYVLAVVLHHIAADGWSMAPLMRDLTLAYEARVAGSAPQYPLLPVQYADYTLWQQELLGSEDDPGSLLSRQLDYWRAELAGAPAELVLPTDRPRPVVSSHQGASIPFEVNAQLHQRIVQIARDNGVSVFMVLQAAVAALLSKLSADSDNDIVMGSPIAGRNDAALDELVGFFVNTVVLRTDLSGNPTFEELLARVRNTDLAAFEHADVPFELLVEQLNPERSLNRHPLFQVMLVLQNNTEGELPLPDVEISDHPVESTTTKFDLSFYLGENFEGHTPAGLTGGIEYATDLFNATTIEALAQRLTNLLDILTANPNQPVSAVSVLLNSCLLYTSPSPRDVEESRMPSSA